MTQKERYISQMEAQLKEWGGKLGAMKAKLEEAELHGRLEFHKQVELSQRQHEVARRNLDELKQAGEDAWEALKVGVESAWKEFAKSVEHQPR